MLPELKEMFPPLTSLVSLACLPLALLLTACRGETEPRAGRVEPTRTEATAGTPHAPIQSTPEHGVGLPAMARRLPFPAKGFSFRGGRLGEDGPGFRPIGEARFGPDGGIYLSFPERDVVVAFTGDHGDLRVFGSRAYGGNDEIIKNPERLRFVGRTMYLANRQNGQILALGIDGSFHNAFQTPNPAALSGSGPQFLITSSRQPGTFARVDDRNQAVQFYRLPQNPDGSSPRARLVFDATPQWQIIALAQDMTALYHYDRRGRLKVVLRLRLVEEQSGAHARDLRFFQDRYWLLYVIAARETTPFLVEITPEGLLLQCWSLPMDADGFDIDPERLLLYNRSEATALTFSRD